MILMRMEHYMWLRKVVSSMAKIFKKLFSGDTVATYDGKVVKTLTTEEPTDSIVGTWVLNDTVNLPNTVFNISGSFYVYNNAQNKFFTVALEKIHNSNTNTNVFLTGSSFSNAYYYDTDYYTLPSLTGDYITAYLGSSRGYFNKTTETGLKLRTFEITNATSTDTSGNDNTNQCLTWLKANATKIA